MTVPGAVSITTQPFSKGSYSQQQKSEYKPHVQVYCIFSGKKIFLPPLA